MRSQCLKIEWPKMGIFSLIMKLTDLLEGSEGDVMEWLNKKGLLHECGCGYTVYDPDDVNSAVQARWGDRRCDEIHDWACNLSNKYGWLFIESSKPEYDIYHCQHCEESEWSLIMDMMKISEGGHSGKRKRTVPKVIKKVKLRRQKFIVFIDESYTNEFPRIKGGALTLAALILPEKEVGRLQAAVNEILQKSYNGKSAPKELKYSKLRKTLHILKAAGKLVSELIPQIPSSAIIAVHVPSEGLMGEKTRALRAVGHYQRQAPSADELREAESPEAVESAVREAVTQISQTLAMCVGSYIGSVNARAIIVFDPRKEDFNKQLAEQLSDILPKLPINVPLISHGGSIVMPRPHSSMKRLGKLVKLDFSKTSEESPGLQIADFIAGDIRTFFEDVPEPLDEVLYDKPLVNEKVIFSEAFRFGELSAATKAKIKSYGGRSSLPLYMGSFVNGLIACYARNGQMRNINLQNGTVFDLMD